MSRKNTLSTILIDGINNQKYIVSLISDMYINTIDDPNNRCGGTPVSEKDRLFHFYFLPIFMD